MAVAIRMTRTGTTNRPYWRIIAVDSRDKRDGAYLENLGSYDPINHKIINLHQDKIDVWVSKGAQCSDSVKKLIKMHVKSQKSA